MRLQSKVLLILLTVTILSFLFNILISLLLVKNTLLLVFDEELSVSGDILRRDLEVRGNTLETWLNSNLENSSLLREKLVETKKKFSFWKEKRVSYLQKNWENLPEDKPPLSLFLHNSLSRYLRNISESSLLPVNRISISDETGFLLAFTEKGKNFLLSQEKWWERAKKGNKCINWKGKELSLIIPIRDENTFLGVAKVEINLQKLFHTLKFFSIGKTGSAHLFLGNNLLMSSSNWKGGKKIKGILNSNEYIKKEWKLRFMSSRELGNWSLVVIRAKEESLRTYREVFYHILREFLVIIIGVALLGIFFSRRVTLPLRKIDRFAHKFASGSLSTRISIKTGDELESLARSLNSMADKLQETLKTLQREKKFVERASEMKSTFISAVSHEFKTPLTIIRNYAHLISTGKLGEVTPEQKERLKRINMHSQYLARLVDNLLNLSRLESGEWETFFTKFSLRGLLEKVKEDFSSLARGKGIEILLQLPSRLPTIYSDPFALKIIMDNLVENAIKFTSGEGKVIIKAEKEEEKVRIEVEDMGIGIPEGEEKKIFEPFYRVDREEARKGWGSGLGLSITARLVELLGGKITAKNKKEGGSIFTLYLPLEVKNGKDNGGR